MPIPSNDYLVDFRKLKLLGVNFPKLSRGLVLNINTVAPRS
jgi:hypothetical protein